MEKTNTVTVTGTGTAEAVPELLTLSLAVESRRQDVAAAYEGLGSAVRAVTGRLRSDGVPDRNISTTGINVRADVTWREGEGQVVTGYVASSALGVRLGMPDASQVIAHAVEAGGNDVRLNGMVPGFADEAAVMAQAREKAWHDAEAAATQLASLAGATLGRVEAVAEHPPSGNVVPMSGVRRAAAVESVPVEAGTTAASCALTVTWQLAYPGA
ncbi:SIMPL domain-containing protein [Pseudarthrobacter sp. J75]|uniref:SIMPL domain-containing protein n=1 Tax=unclassified Pseudarthrobacter TaxID=2647000 RepID=UPI002E80049B|nr:MULTISPECIES: SIMPL domain-containing protein [unclassified Pseudarthrobacter]MEE2521861.1 SIMPL domain-containing protein [Pseudarthrobacter sp. J47]MEE2527938.1 SIMPL domain-containing protein [Pseudarthrobacter sp. J75]MEE2569509.1 SIMPL domain-containing protein [Pseudarthrobacter sp. J64]